MGAAYSEDLRRCIIKASEQSKQSVRELAGSPKKERM